MTANSTVCTSKKGEVLLIRKPDKLMSMSPTEDPLAAATEDPEAAAAETTAADQGLFAVFVGPRSVDKKYFTAFRDLFPMLSPTRTLWPNVPEYRPMFLSGDAIFTRSMAPSDRPFCLCTLTYTVQRPLINCHY
jgi:hypothetical protein